MIPVPHSCLEMADGRTWKKHHEKIGHIGYNVDPYGLSFFPNCIDAWNGLAKKIAKSNILPFCGKTWTINLNQSTMHFATFIKYSIFS